MTNTLDRTARWKAAAAALLLLFAGAALGITMDRLRLPAPAAAMPLTQEALLERLDLDGAQEARFRALMDSLHAEVVAAAGEGPEALAYVARAAHERLEASLPAEARPAFREWVEEHHHRFVERLQGGAAHPGHTGP